jgi:hypothetical protein
LLADAGRGDVFSLVVIMKLYQLYYQLNSKIIPLCTWAGCEDEAKQICDRLFAMAFGRVAHPVECRILH